MPLPRLAVRFGVLALVVGCVGLLGALDGLASFVSGRAPMQPIVAVAFIAGGIAIVQLALAAPGRRGERLGFAAAGLTAALGVLTALPLCGMDAAGRGLVRQTSLTAPAVAFGLVTTGVALLLSRSRWPRLHNLVDVLGLMTVSVALLGLVGYAFDLFEVYAVPSFGTVSLPSGLALFFLGLGACALRPGPGLAAAFTDSSMGGMLARRLIPPTVVLPLLLGWGHLWLIRREVYEPEFGITALVLAQVAVFSGLIAYSGRTLSRVAAERTAVYLQMAERDEAVRLTFSHLPLGIVRSAPNGTILGVNPAFARMLRMPEEQLLGKNLFDLTHPEDRDADRLEAARVLAGHGDHYAIDKRYLTAGGAEVLCSVTATAVRDEHGEVRFGVGIVEDVTERRRIEEELRWSEERFRTALQNAPVVVFNQDTDLRYTWIHNPLGYETADVLGRRDSDLFPNPSEAKDLEAVKREVLASGEGRRLEMHLSLGSDSKDYDLTIEPQRDRDGRTVGITCAALDVTERRKHEQAMRETQKLESIGLLAGGIAHDFNNLLTGILGNASLALALLPPRGMDHVEPLLEEVVDASERAATLTNQLLAYAGKGRFEIVPLDLGRLVTDLTALLRSSVPRKVQLEVEVEPGLPLIEADATQLQQVVMNLVINGAEAVEEQAGRVSLRVGTTEVAPDEAMTFLGYTPKPGRYVELRVRDDGTGMDRATLEQIFDPFFTTKFTGRGLGLAATQGIVRGHRGAVEVMSAPGIGTTFRVLLPVASGSMVAAEPPARPSAQAAKPTGPGPWVLVVDDEPAVRRLARLSLEDHGYRVILADDGAAAVEAALARGHEIALVVMDLDMPVLDGVQAAERIRGLWPQIPIVGSTGYGDVEGRARFASQATRLLPKPYRAEDLVRTVTDAIGSEAACLGTEAFPLGTDVG